LSYQGMGVKRFCLICFAVLVK